MRTEPSSKVRTAVFRLRVLFVAVFGGGLLFSSTVLWAQRNGSSEVVVIVNRQNATTSLSNEFLRQAFLKQVTRWQDDESIRPVDLGVSSHVRRRFTEGVLGRSVEAVKSYWQQRVFSGRDIPPPELASEEAVVTYVEAHPGAVGYVSKDADLTSTKVVAVIR